MNKITRVVRRTPNQGVVLTLDTSSGVRVVASVKALKGNKQEIPDFRDLLGAVIPSGEYRGFLNSMVVRMRDLSGF